MRSQFLVALLVAGAAVAQVPTSPPPPPTPDTNGARVLIVDRFGAGDFTSVGAAAAWAAANPAPAFVETWIEVAPADYWASFETPFSLPAFTSVVCRNRGGGLTVAGSQPGLYFNATSGVMLSLGRNSAVVGCFLFAGPSGALTGDLIVVSNASATTPSYNRLQDVSIQTQVFTPAGFAVVGAASNGASRWLDLIDSKTRHLASPGTNSPHVRVTTGQLTTWRHWFAVGTGETPSHGLRVVSGNAVLYGSIFSRMDDARTPGGFVTADIQVDTGAAWLSNTPYTTVVGNVTERWLPMQRRFEPQSADPGCGPKPSLAVRDNGAEQTLCYCNGATWSLILAAQLGPCW